MMASCLSAIRVKQPDGTFNDVPCGRCGYCLSNRRKEWSFRLQKEARCHESCSFITLTYSNENLPYSDHVNTDTGVVTTYPVLRKKDVQKFIKRLRYAQSKLTDKKIKYYLVGEYGSETRRPHYHALMFGLRREVSIYDEWKLGIVDVGDVNMDSIDYVTKYVVNKNQYKHYVVPPFSMISNGIGLGHLEKNYERYKGEEYVRGGRGYNQRMPRYYRDKLGGENKWIKKINQPKKLEEFDRKIDEEVERLKKIGHEEPEHYMEESRLHHSNKILEKAKDGGIL